MIRELSSNSKPTFYQCTVFSPATPTARECTQLPMGWPASDCIVYFRTGAVTGDNSIVYDLYFLAVRWTVHAKIVSFEILLYL